MSKEYTVTDWQPWIDRNTDTGEPIRDAHGNFKGSVWFDESPEQVDGTFKTQPAKGDKKYGDVVDYETRTGQLRRKFQRADRPQEEGAQATLIGKAVERPADDYWDDKNAQLRAQWAIGRARESMGALTEEVLADQKTTLKYFEDIEYVSKQFFAMVDRVKGLKVEAPVRGVEEAVASEQAKRDAKQLGKELVEDQDFASLLNSQIGDEIDLTEIPF